MIARLTWLYLWIAVLCTGVSAQEPVVSGELKLWHTITLNLIGPESGESGSPNPFLDYRCSVVFRHTDKTIEVPGFYAADGHAAETGATKGHVWRVYFVPDEIGEWSYSVLFRTANNIALSDAEGEGVYCDGQSGKFQVGPSDKTAPDFRARGMLRYVGKSYLQFAGSGEYFLKGGADSPENFLAYTDFDDTYDSAELRREGEAAGEIFLHQYGPHIRDFKPFDPTWQNGKGKGIIGALNYLASKGMNSVYFLTYNIDGGDGKDVWPWTAVNERFRFDCSKLDQWEIVFSHMDRLGLAQHVVTQETENDQGLDGGELGPQRKLYYRELIARFAHHPALIWNLGEENTNTDAQRKAFCQYIKDLDPYDHPIVCHTFPNQYDEVYTPLLGFAYFDGPSLQTIDTHTQTIKWLDASLNAGRPWFVCLDEVAVADTGVKPDVNDFWHDEIRSRHLWGNLMAGGAGVEWYFGYTYAHNDLNCEDWRSRDHMWDLTRYALAFFQQYLPFTEMSHHDELTAAAEDYCFAKPGDIYAVYLPHGGTTELDLGNATAAYSVHWYNPRTGGALQTSDVVTVQGPGQVSLGLPPDKPDKDWVVLVRKR